MALTARDIIDDPWTVGYLCRFTPRILASALGIHVNESSDENTTFGWVTGDNARPHVWMPDASNAVDDRVFRASNNALLHYIFRHLANLSDWCDCCDGSELWMHPGSVNQLVEAMCHNYWKYDVLPPHFFENTVWARAFMRSNRLYMDPAIDVVMDVDRKHDFWMPSFRDIGEVRRTKHLWVNSGQKRSIESRLQSPSREVSDGR